MIGMVKQLNQRYYYKGKSYTLPKLQKFASFDGAGNIFGSLWVTTKSGIPVKIVFVQNRNKSFSKASKSFMKLGTEFQRRSYDAIVNHTAIVFTGYIILEWIRCKQNDEKT